VTLIGEIAMSATATTTTVATTATAPSVHRRAVITWLAVYPTITLVLGFLGPATAHLPLPLRTLILTGFVVPTVAYGLIPLLTKANAAFSRR
jgi:antibiotic biosynthesis monooxygenase (ABM) superfamily enzyme